MCHMNQLGNVTDRAKIVLKITLLLVFSTELYISWSDCTNLHILFIPFLINVEPGRVVQTVVRLTQEPEVPVTCFRFTFH